MPEELSLLDKVALASELSTEIIVGILRRRAAGKLKDIGTLIADATNNSQEADLILDKLEVKGHEPAPETE